MVKDKQKRDAALIKRLDHSNQEAWKKAFQYQRIAKKLIKLALDSGACSSDVFEAVEEDHFLRKHV